MAFFAYLFAEYWDKITGGIFIILLIGAAFGILVSNMNWEKAAISRGFALHCPSDGSFAWKGECDN